MLTPVRAMCSATARGKAAGNPLRSAHAISMKGTPENPTPDSNGAYRSKYIGNCSVYTAENRDGNIGIPTELL